MSSCYWCQRNIGHWWHDDGSWAAGPAWAAPKWADSEGSLRHMTKPGPIPSTGEDEGKEGKRSVNCWMAFGGGFLVGILVVLAWSLLVIAGRSE